MTDPILVAADEAFKILTALPSPRDAANAIALMNTWLIEEACKPEIRTEAQVRIMMGEMVEVVIANWRLRTRITS